MYTPNRKIGKYIFLDFKIVELKFLYYFTIMSIFFCVNHHYLGH